MTKPSGFNPPYSLYRAQERVTKRCMTLLADYDLILAGGTALSRCYLQHRVSFDLDFFISGCFHPDRLLRDLALAGVRLEEVRLGSKRFVTQVLGIAVVEDVAVEVAFIEDPFEGMFEPVFRPFLDLEGNARLKVRTEELWGLYHRKLRAVAGSGFGMDEARVLGGRQTARDLFDLYCLNRVRKISEFIEEINREGANFPVPAFLEALSSFDLRNPNLHDQWNQIVMFGNGDGRSPTLLEAYEALWEEASRLLLSKPDREPSP